METLGTKFFSFLFLTMFGGGWTVPLGCPPAAEDPALARAAPEQCLFYASWAGLCTADAKSRNQTEQLLAEPEVQHSAAALAAIFSDTVLPELANMTSDGAAPVVAATAPYQPAGPTEPVPPVRSSRDRDAAAARRSATDFARIVATHPTAVFATKITLNKDGQLSGMRGGVVVAAGADVEKLRAVFDDFRNRTKSAAPAQVREVQIAGHTWYRFTGPAGRAFDIPVICGFHGSDFILGVGDGSVEEILARRQKAPPAWLADLRKQLPIERASTVVYLNPKMLLDQVTAGVAMPKTREALRRMGLDKISALSSVSGLDGETFTSKMLLSTDGEPQGILQLFSDRPLRADDLKPIPCDSTLSLAMRYDAEKAAEQLSTIAAPFANEPPTAAPTASDRVSHAMSKPLQVDFRHELPKALGDSCCVYSSPGEGGLITAVFSVKDHKAMSAIQLKLVTGALANSVAGAVASPEDDNYQRTATRIQSCRCAGQTIFCANVGMSGIAPAWCLTDRELIVAMTPQNIMAYLQRGAGHKSLATVPQVGLLLAGGGGPSMLAHIDSMRVFELVYPLVPLYAPMGLNSFGGAANPLAPDAFPSFPAIRRHLVPGTAALRRTKHGVELVSRQPLPATGLLWTAGLLSQSPKSLEQQIAAEGRPRPDMTAYVGQPRADQPYVQSPSAAPGAYAPYVAPANSSATYVPAAPGAPVLAPGVAPTLIAPVGAPGFSAATADLSLTIIGKAVKAYRIKHNTMPPAYLADKQGKPLLSWRVALLPYLGQDDLYKRFHLDESWDSPNNRPLIALMPDIYRELVPAPAPVLPTGLAPVRAAPPSANDVAGTTVFLLLRGPKTVYADVSPPMPRTYEDWVKTIVVVVRPERAVPWTKPEDFTYDPKDPAAGLSENSGDAMLQAGSAAYLIPPPLSDDKVQAERDRRLSLLQAFTGEEASTGPSGALNIPYIPVAPPTLPAR